MINTTKGYHFWLAFLKRKSTNLSRFIIHIPCICPSIHSEEGSGVSSTP